MLVTFIYTRTLVSRHTRLTFQEGIVGKTRTHGVGKPLPCGGRTGENWTLEQCYIWGRGNAPLHEVPRGTVDTLYGMCSDRVESTRALDIIEILHTNEELHIWTHIKAFCVGGICDATPFS